MQLEWISFCDHVFPICLGSSDLQDKVNAIYMKKV